MNVEHFCIMFTYDEFASGAAARASTHILIIPPRVVYVVLLNSINFYLQLFCTKEFI